MLHVGCGSVGLILACATMPTTQHATPASPRRICFMMNGLSLSILGPGHTLLRLGDRAETLEDEALHARAGIGFRRVEIALRIGVQVVNAKKLPRLPAAVTKRREHVERAAEQDVDLLVHTVGGVDIRLLRIAR